MTWARLAPLDPSTPDYEHLEQVRFFNLLSNVNHPAARLAFAVPNQAVAKFRSKAARVRFWKEGVRAGAPDVLVLWPIGERHGLALEFKRPGENPRPEQVEFLERLDAAGYQTAVVFSAKQAFQTLLEYLEVEVNWR
jgi:hypothetical protein